MGTRDLDIRVEFEGILDQHFVIYSHLAKKLSEIFLKTYSLPDSYELILESFESVLAPEMGYCRPLVVELMKKAFEIIEKKIKMKVIFLDHDGVICLPSEHGGQYKKQREVGRKAAQSISSIPIAARFDDFNGEAIKILNEIISTTNAEIVVSSDWKRRANLSEMGEYYGIQGVIKKPIAFTKKISEVVVPKNFNWKLTLQSEQSRSLEIKQFLNEHPEITNWVAVDDLNMGGDNTWSLSNFVLTNPDKGLNEQGIKEKILSFLV